MQRVLETVAWCPTRKNVGGRIGVYRAGDVPKHKSQAKFEARVPRDLCLAAHDSSDLAQELAHLEATLKYPQTVTGAQSAGGQQSDPHSDPESQPSGDRTSGDHQEPSSGGMPLGGSPTQVLTTKRRTSLPKKFEDSEMISVDGGVDDSSSSDQDDSPAMRNEQRGSAAPVGTNQRGRLTKTVSGYRRGGNNLVPDLLQMCATTFFPNTSTYVVAYMALVQQQPVRTNRSACLETCVPASMGSATLCAVLHALPSWI